MEDALEKAGGELIQLNAASKNPLIIRKNPHLIEALVAEHDIDLNHARSRAPGWSAYVAAQRTETPFVTTYHGAYSGR